jgi:CRP/FNR family transcriptional regulator
VLAPADRALLDALPLFRDLAPAARHAVAAGGVVRRYAPGEVLWAAGADPGGLAVVLAGRVRVVRAPGGRQHALHDEGPGGTLGEVPLFAGGRYPATALAAEATRCLILDRATLARAVAADPELAFRLLGRLAARVRGLVARLDRRDAATVEQRVAALLLERRARAGARGSAAFALGATQAEAAEELGTVREVLVRALGRLRGAGLVDRAGAGRYRVLDGAALRRVAGAMADPPRPG